MVIPAILERFAAKNVAREKALSGCRAMIRLSANSIRAVHRAEFPRAAELLEEARLVHVDIRAALDGHPDLYTAGFVHDAQKEYAEAWTTFQLLSGHPIPTPESLGVEDPAYLNGIAEAVGELRRMVMDRLRQGAPTGCEDILTAMDDIYAVLVTIDFPDAMTGGLRRTTDLARGILEKTRGDLTMAMVQYRALGAVPAPADDLS